MASRRRLKKDIDYLCFQVISDCYTYNYLHPGKEKEVAKIIHKTVELRNNLFFKVNNPGDSKNSKSIKKYYKNVSGDLIKNINASFDKLSELVKEK